MLVEESLGKCRGKKKSKKKELNPLLQHPYIFDPWCTNVAP